MAAGTLADVRRALAEAVAHLVDGRAYAHMPDQIPIGPPVVVVVVDPGDTVIERQTFGIATMRYLLRLRVIVGSQSDRVRQEVIDPLISPYGPVSLWATVEEAGAMRDAADYCEVLAVTNYGEFTEGDAAFMTAELVCAVVQSL